MGPPALWVPSLQRFHTAEDPQIVDETSIEEVRTAYEATQILPSPA